MIGWDEGFSIMAGDTLAVAQLGPRELCALCRGTGRREIDMGGVPRWGRCRCQRLVDRVRFWNEARVPAYCATHTMESFETDAKSHDGAKIGRDYVRQWLDAYVPGETHRGFVLEGLPGRGKTHLLVGVVRELVFRHGVEVRFVEFTHLLAEMREAIDRGDHTGPQLSRMVDVPVLAIDELGKGRLTEWELTVLDEIVTRAYNGRTLILGTTNFQVRERTPEEAALALKTEKAPGIGSLAGPPPLLSARVGDRVWSRLSEMVDFLPTRGVDRRATTTGRGVPIRARQ